MRFPIPHPSISRTARSIALAALALAMLGLGGACEDMHVGRLCELGTSGMTGGGSGQIATFGSPALECPSRICLLPGAEKDPRSNVQMSMGLPGTSALCTATCEENADCEDGETGDANNPADTRCRSGFACTWPIGNVGSFACQRMCVCRDFVYEPPGGFVKPADCN